MLEWVSVSFWSWFVHLYRAWRPSEWLSVADTRREAAGWAWAQARYQVAEERALRKIEGDGRMS